MSVQETPQSTTPQPNTPQLACKASVDMFGLTKDDFVEQIQDIITVGEFYEKAAGGQIIFT